MTDLTRRRFVSLCGAAIAVAAGVVGCGEEPQKQGGSAVETPQDIQDALNRSSEGYAAEKKKK